MGLFDSKGSGKQVDANNSAPAAISNVERNISDVQNALKEAYIELGKKYYESNKDNVSAEFASQASKIKELIGKEELWQQYSLSIDGKVKCESCGAIITSDSLFCNKCGGSIKPRDFSSLGVASEQPVESITVKKCPSCGSPLVEGAMFCEKCGQKL